MSKSDDSIAANVKHILETLPPGVILVAAAKARRPEEVEAALRAGVTHVGHNYVQEAERMIPAIEAPQLRDKVRWHMIGHLQKNKVKKAVRLFDMIETVDSWPLAELIDRRCAAIGKTMPVLVEINSGREASKTGVLPEEVDDLVRRLSDLQHIRVQGLMTMGPRFGNPEDARPYFRATKAAFDRLARANLPNIEMRYLSMGMSNSYQVAIEEGANMVRLGTVLFGERPP
ncbi:MAG TPA: YggS family pyridoxal phosphate-dependent enzyme [Anaerolineae bacterium]|nr:YggS family pyridoxal phosphate-dependent enzyme [Anaerolineae bacterium]HIP96591.1 YggS family pyridoxal phosphate-dependent enzyme [Anaerolineae bacterium]